MRHPGSFGARLKALREAAGFTQDELATIAGLSVQAIGALERGARRRPHLDTVRALSAALDLDQDVRASLIASARGHAHDAASDELSRVALPVPPTALIGREDEVRSLRLSLEDAGTRLVTLVGAGGVGKTRLALEVASALASVGASRVMFVELATIRDPGFVALAIGDALGLSNVTAATLAQQVRASGVRTPRVLLVLDNCEHLPGIAPLIADLLGASASLRVLATSRSPLRVRGERLHTVEPLWLPLDADTASLAEMIGIPALRLFVERARDVHPAFRLTSRNVATVVAICRRLDALPLALELAASRLNVLTLDELLHRLDRDALRSTIGPQDLPERQQTVTATVAWSYQLLDPELRCAFRLLAALPGRFPMAAAAAVLGSSGGGPTTTDWAASAIAGLMERSLLRRIDIDGDWPCYQMLETVRSYGLTELGASGQLDDALSRLLAYARDRASSAAVGLVGPQQVVWVHRVRDDLPTYRAALKLLIARGRAVEAAEILSRLNFFWLIRGHTAEGLAWSEQLLGTPAAVPAVESRALTTAGIAWYARGELMRARGAFARVLDLAEREGDVDMCARAEHMLGRIAHGLGDVVEARTRFAGSLDRFRALSTPWGMGAALSGLAWVAFAGGRVGDTARLLDEATRHLHGAGPWFVSSVSYLRAIVEVQRGRADEAIALVRTTMAHIRELHDKFAFVHLMVPLAAAAVIKGDHAWAARVLGALAAVTDRTRTTVVERAVAVLLETTTRTTQARLGPDRWERAFSAGREASIDALLKEAGPCPVTVPAQP